jgi:hypothetical protein
MAMTVPVVNKRTFYEVLDVRVNKDTAENSIFRHKRAHMGLITETRGFRRISGSPAASMKMTVSWVVAPCCLVELTFQRC